MSRSAGTQPTAKGDGISKSRCRMDVFSKSGGCITSIHQFSVGISYAGLIEFPDSKELSYRLTKNVKIIRLAQKRIRPCQSGTITVVKSRQGSKKEYWCVWILEPYVLAKVVARHVREPRVQYVKIEFTVRDLLQSLARACHSYDGTVVVLVPQHKTDQLAGVSVVLNIEQSGVMVFHRFDNCSAFSKIKLTWAQNLALTRGCKDALFPSHCSELLYLR